MIFSCCFMSYTVHILNKVEISFTRNLCDCTNQVWTWGKGDYFRLGLGTDQHVRKPTLVEALRGERIVHVAVGALHCLAVTDTGVVSDIKLTTYIIFNYMFIKDRC